MFLVTLSPLKNGEPPADDDQELPAIQLHSHPLSYQASSLTATNEVRLGRNGLTKLVDTRLPRSLASVRVTEGGEMTLSLLKRPEEHSVHLNGERITSLSVPLLNGSILALLDGNKCQYRISIVEDNGTQPTSKMGSSTLLVSSSTPSIRSSAPASAITTTTNQESDGIRHRRIHQVCEELLCPVCMDILVQTVALNPCGHLFCSSCRQGPVSFCPTCRTPAFGAMPLKSIDSIILHMVKGGEGLLITLLWSSYLLVIEMSFLCSFFVSFSLIILCIK